MQHKSYTTQERHPMQNISQTCYNNFNQIQQNLSGSYLIEPTTCPHVRLQEMQQITSGGGYFMPFRPCPNLDQIQKGEILINMMLRKAERKQVLKECRNETPNGPLSSKRFGHQRRAKSGSEVAQANDNLDSCQRRAVPGAVDGLSQKQSKIPVPINRVKGGETAQNQSQRNKQRDSILPSASTKMGAQRCKIPLSSRGQQATKIEDDKFYDCQSKSRSSLCVNTKKCSSSRKNSSTYPLTDCPIERRSLKYALESTILDLAENNFKTKSKIKREEVEACNFLLDLIKERINNITCDDDDDSKAMSTRATKSCICLRRWSEHKGPESSSSSLTSSMWSSEKENQPPTINEPREETHNRMAQTKSKILLRHKPYETNTIKRIMACPNNNSAEEVGSCESDATQSFVSVKYIESQTLEADHPDNREELCRANKAEINGLLGLISGNCERDVQQRIYGDGEVSNGTSERLAEDECQAMQEQSIEYEEETCARVLEVCLRECCAEVCPRECSEEDECQAMQERSIEYEEEMCAPVPEVCPRECCAKVCSKEFSKDDKCQAMQERSIEYVEEMCARVPEVCPKESCAEVCARECTEDEPKEERKVGYKKTNETVEKELSKPRESLEQNYEEFGTTKLTKSCSKWFFCLDDKQRSRGESLGLLGQKTDIFKPATERRKEEWDMDISYIPEEETTNLVEQNLPRERGYEVLKFDIKVKETSAGVCLFDHCSPNEEKFNEAQQCPSADACEKREVANEKKVLQGPIEEDKINMKDKSLMKEVVNKTSEETYFFCCIPPKKPIEAAYTEHCSSSNDTNQENNYPDDIQQCRCSDSYDSLGQRRDVNDEKVLETPTSQVEAKETITGIGPKCKIRQAFKAYDAKLKDLHRSPPTKVNIKKILPTTRIPAKATPRCNIKPDVRGSCANSCPQTKDKRITQNPVKLNNFITKKVPICNIKEALKMNNSSSNVTKKLRCVDADACMKSKDVDDERKLPTPLLLNEDKLPTPTCTVGKKKIITDQVSRCCIKREVKVDDSNPEDCNGHSISGKPQFRCADSYDLFSKENQVEYKKIPHAPIYAVEESDMAANSRNCSNSNETNLENCNCQNISSKTQCRCSDSYDSLNDKTTLQTPISQVDERDIAANKMDSLNSNNSTVSQYSVPYPQRQKVDSYNKLPQTSICPVEGNKITAENESKINKNEEAQVNYSNSNESNPENCNCQSILSKTQCRCIDSYDTISKDIEEKKILPIPKCEVGRIKTTEKVVSNRNINEEDKMKCSNSNNSNQCQSAELCSGRKDENFDSYPQRKEVDNNRLLQTPVCPVEEKKVLSSCNVDEAIKKEPSVEALKNKPLRECYCFNCSPTKAPIELKDFKLNYTNSNAGSPKKYSCRKHQPHKRESGKETQESSIQNKFKDTLNLVKVTLKPSSISSGRSKEKTDYLTHTFFKCLAEEIRKNRIESRAEWKNQAPKPTPQQVHKRPPYCSDDRNIEQDCCDPSTCPWIRSRPSTGDPPRERESTASQCDQMNKKMPTCNDSKCWMPNATSYHPITSDTKDVINYHCNESTCAWMPKEDSQQNIITYLNDTISQRSNESSCCKKRIVCQPIVDEHKISRDAKNDQENKEVTYCTTANCPWMQRNANKEDHKINGTAENGIFSNEMRVLCCNAVNCSWKQNVSIEPNIVHATADDIAPNKHTESCNRSSCLHILKEKMDELRSADILNQMRSDEQVQEAICCNDRNCPWKQKVPIEQNMINDTEEITSCNRSSCPHILKEKMDELKSADITKEMRSDEQHQQLLCCNESNWPWKQILPIAQNMINDKEDDIATIKHTTSRSRSSCPHILQEDIDELSSANVILKSGNDSFKDENEHKLICPFESKLATIKKGCSIAKEQKNALAKRKECFGKTKRCSFSDDVCVRTLVPNSTQDLGCIPSPLKAARILDSENNNNFRPSNFESKSVDKLPCKEKAHDQFKTVQDCNLYCPNHIGTEGCSFIKRKTAGAVEIPTSHTPYYREMYDNAATRELNNPGSGGSQEDYFSCSSYSSASSTGTSETSSARPNDIHISRDQRFLSARQQGGGLCNPYEKAVPCIMVKRNKQNQLRQEQERFCPCLKCVSATHYQRTIQNLAIPVAQCHQHVHFNEAEARPLANSMLPTNRMPPMHQIGICFSCLDRARYSSKLRNDNDAIVSAGLNPWFAAEKWKRMQKK